MSNLTQSNLLPFNQYAEAEVINMFALDGTGLAGMLVSLPTGLQDPATSAGAYSANAVGAAYTNVTSLRYGATRKVRPSVGSDTVGNVLGFTLYTSADVDENGQKLILQPIDHVTERGFVYSGQVVPVLTRGLITLKTSNIVGVPLPGYFAVPSTGGNGKVEVVNPNSFTGVGGTYTGQLQVLGKFISSTGSAFGGYVQLLVRL